LLGPEEEICEKEELIKALNWSSCATYHRKFVLANKKGERRTVDLLPFHQNKIGIARNQMDPRDGGREKPIATVWYIAG